MSDHIDFDGFLELVPNKATMKVRMEGETKDKRAEMSGGAAVIEITSFSFGNAKALEAVAKQTKAENKAGGGGEEGEAPPPVPQIDIPASKQSDNIDENYRFQITKQIERSSPHLMQAFMASSFKPKRKEYNDFAEARIVVRKRQGRTAPKPYLFIKFGKVRVAGYTLETQGAEPPFETVSFCFRTCEIRYMRQKDDGTFDTPVVRAWDFEAAKEKKQ